MGYLVNVVRALDVDWAEGEEWRELMEVSEEEFKARLEERRERERSGEESPRDVTRGVVLERVGKLRGWGSS